MDSKKISAWEAAMLIAGSGLGTGILAIPYAASRTGLFGIVFSVAAAFAASVLMHLLVADLVLNSKNSTQLMGIFKEHLFKGKNERLFSSMFFAVLAVVLLFNLAIYILVAAEVLTESFGIAPSVSKIIFYSVSSLIVVAGIKIIGVSEKYSMIIIGGVVLFLTVKSVNHSVRNMELTFGSYRGALALYGLVMFSFSALFSIPQAANNIENKNKLKTAIIAGIAINAAITLFFTFSVIKASDTVTQVATIGLSSSLGNMIKVVCALFVVLAMFTSYLSIALAQIDIICTEIKVKRNGAFMGATVPSLLAALFLPMSFISMIQVVGGIVAVITSLLVIPGYIKATEHSRGNLMLGNLGKNKLLLSIVLVSYILMAVSSFIN
ncbi:MAG: aromatic amino acid transport family protein [Sedimentibacter saalensis]|uniref:aromatic amino acid transport family protein n=1 Tax=Sedimentibacter saalensis TaxID=130788 RepID=UPI002B1FCE42|nr:aromatic amino acid transport family protein [Sedimentibacter saalensis]MEA5096384.1 aromatic amino acid transport family protein [Sedimentibacter saalensis]